MPGRSYSGAMRRRLGSSTAVLALALVAGLAGCASLDLDLIDTRVDQVALPAPLEAPRAGRVAVHFDPGLRDAAPVVRVHDQQRQRHVIGAALVSVLREVLAARFAEVVELAAPPAPGAVDADVAMVFGAPVVATRLRPDAVSMDYETTIRLPVTLTGGGRSEVADIAARVGIPSLVGWVFEHRALDEQLLRGTAASLAAHLLLPPWAPAARAAAPAVPGAPTDLVVVRLDAQAARGDEIERTWADCVAAASPPPSARSGVGGPPPSAPQLRDALFPWLDPGVVDPHDEALATTLGRAAVRDRLAALGVGRLLLLSVRDEGRETIDRLGCLGGGAAAACAGRLEETERYVLRALLWDAAAAAPRAREDLQVHVTTGAVGVLLPIPYLSSNRTEVCARLRALVQPAPGAGSP